MLLGEPGVGMLLLRSQEAREEGSHEEEERCGEDGERCGDEVAVAGTDAGAEADPNTGAALGGAASVGVGGVMPISARMPSRRGGVSSLSLAARRGVVEIVPAVAYFHELIGVKPLRCSCMLKRGDRAFGGGGGGGAAP